MNGTRSTTSGHRALASARSGARCPLRSPPESSGAYAPTAERREHGTSRGLESRLHTREVGGSKPPVPISRKRLLTRAFSVLCARLLKGSKIASWKHFGSTRLTQAALRRRFRAPRETPLSLHSSSSERRNQSLQPGRPGERDRPRAGQFVERALLHPQVRERAVEVEPAV
jgi:hypothetical protein